jgi:hypothetical protein
MEIKTICATLAAILTVVGFAPYLRGIVTGTIRPHAISWVIWAITTLIAAAAQLSAGAGWGGAVIAFSGVATVLIAIAAYAKRADCDITRTDWQFLLAALASLPVWFFTGSPLAAGVVLTLVDLLGFGPTLRKSYVDPHSESVTFFAIFATRNALAIAALNELSVATAIFPAAVGAGCVFVVALILVRRQKLSSLGSEIIARDYELNSLNAHLLQDIGLSSASATDAWDKVRSNVTSNGHTSI